MEGGGSKIPLDLPPLGTDPSRAPEELCPPEDPDSTVDADGKKVAAAGADA